MVAGAAYGAYQRGLWRFHYPPRSRFPDRGIDVSHHQGTIDWRAVRADGIDFAYIKASEGIDFLDPGFARNWEGARSQGIVPGAYHYFSLCHDGALQAARFLSAVPPPAPREAPPAVDLEYGGNCAHPPAPEVVCAEVERFLELVEAARGPVLLYATDDFLDAHAACLPRRRLWVRAIVLGPRGGFALWQYANRGRVAGIEGPVDLDVAAP